MDGLCVKGWCRENLLFILSAIFTAAVALSFTPIYIWLPISSVIVVLLWTLTTHWWYATVFLLGLFHFSPLPHNREIFTAENYFQGIREICEKDIDRAFDSEEVSQERGMIKALFYCGRGELSPQVKNAFQLSGMMHLLALSGMHLGIIYMLVGFLLKPLGNYPICVEIRSLTIITVLWFYTFFAGCGISLSRAMIMITIYECGKLIGRSTTGLNALGASSAIILCCNPSAVTSLSFILSFGAMLGIFSVFPCISKICSPGVPIIRSIWNLTCINISCTAITLPITLLEFGTYSNYSMLLNLLCTPLATIVVALIPLWELSQLLLPCASEIAGKVIIIFIRLILKIIGIVT